MVGVVRIFQDADEVVECPLGDFAFDAQLHSLWADREQRGVIRYGIEHLERRSVGRLAVQFNPGRARKEQDLERPWRDETPVLARSEESDNDFLTIQATHPLQRLFELEVEPRPITINVNYAPILPGHSILIPDPSARRPQHLTPAALKDAQLVIELSSSPSFWVGFNSLGSWASINHLHFHAFDYPGAEMPVQRATRQELRAADPKIERLTNYPLRALVISEPDPKERLAAASRFVSVLQEDDVPHTLLLNRDEAYVFPKSRDRGELTATGAGYFETGGEIFLGDRSVYEDIDEATLWKELAIGSLDEASFASLVERFFEDLW